MYTISSTKRWPLLRKHVFNVSVRSRCEVRCECKIDSVNTLRYQLPEVCEALDKLTEETGDAMIEREADTLYKTLKQYKFLVSLVLWYDVLFRVNFVSKELTSRFEHSNGFVQQLDDLAKETES